LIGGTVGLAEGLGLAVAVGGVVGVDVGVDGGVQQSLGNVGVGVAGVPRVQPASTNAKIRPAAKTSGGLIGYLPA
jgi:hypothetical protein